MSAIEAASGAVRTLADGTLRLTVDIEPRHAQAAFALFGAPGTPVALAALKTAAQQEKPKGGPIAKWLALRCQEPEFQDWAFRSFPDMARHFPHSVSTTPEDACAFTVRCVVGVTSRAEIDSNPDARARFEKLIREPWARAMDGKR